LVGVQDSDSQDVELKGVRLKPEEETSDGGGSPNVTVKEKILIKGCN